MKVSNFSHPLALFAALPLALTAAMGQASPTAVALTSNSVYEKNCAKCHGKTAEGRHFGGPALLSENTRAKSPDELRAIINNGKGRMPKYATKLTPEEVDTLVQQINSPNKK